MPGIADEVIEELVFGRCQIEAFSPQACLLLREVDLEIA